MAESTWIFGYGSLVWRPAFDFVEREVGLVHGYARRFWQGSSDHRGVPGAPGRVVTLVAAADESCAGVAYRIAPERAHATLARLDERERGGYERARVDVELAEGACVRAVTWVASPSNPNYLGEASLDAMARVVRSSRGPSGHNVEYVLELARALGRLGVRDAHVEALAALVGD